MTRKKLIGIPPLVSLLDPRPSLVAGANPIRDSVNIPLHEWRGRTHEFPSPREELLVPSLPDCDEAFLALQKMGRLVERTNLFGFGPREPRRLWSPNPWLMECVSSLEPGAAVDLGCGVGREAVALSALGWEVVAIDRLPDALERGRDLEQRTLGTDQIAWQVQKLSGIPPITKPNLAFMGYFLDRDLVRTAHEWLAPGGSLILHLYTDLHFRRHGKPVGAPSVAELMALATNLRLADSRVSAEDERHTASAWFRRE